MEWFEYLIIIAVVSFVALVAFFGIRNKLKPKKASNHCGCCSSCNKGGCPYCNKTDSLK